MIPRVTYSHAIHVGGKGQGYVALGTARALADHGALEAVLCVSRSEEAAADPEVGPRLRPVLPLGWWWERAVLAPGRVLPSLRYSTFRWKDDAYDRLASLRLSSRTQVLLGWNHHCLHTLRKARRRGIRTVVEVPTSHVMNQYRIVMEECERWGVAPETQHHPAFLDKCVQEYEEADGVHVSSDYARRSMLDEGVAAERIACSPYGIDEVRFRPPASAPPPRPFRVCCIGMIGLRKGVLYLLEAWDRLGLPDAELVLGGKVDREMEPLLARWRGREDIRFAGWVDPAEVMQRSHLSILPTLEDGFATVVPESMACGVPVVVTVNTGAKDLVREGKDGFIVPIRDPEAIARRILTLYEDEELRIEMGRSGIGQAARHGWQERGRVLAAFLEELAAC